MGTPLICESVPMGTPLICESVLMGTPLICDDPLAGLAATVPVKPTAPNPATAEQSPPQSGDA
jgi:hypothetical protein